MMVRRITLISFILAVSLMLLPSTATAMSSAAGTPGPEPANEIVRQTERNAGAAVGQFQANINALRASRGLNTLTVDGELQGTAQWWAGQMLANGTLAHDPGLGTSVTGWSHIGENVGIGSTVDATWQAFLNSPAHFGALIDPSYTAMGVGVVLDNGGSVWTVHRFINRIGSTAPPAAVPPAPAPAPVVTNPAPAPAPTPVVTESTPETTTTTAPPSAKTAIADEKVIAEPTTTVAPPTTEQPAPVEILEVEETDAGTPRSLLLALPLSIGAVALSLLFLMRRQ